MNFLLKFKGENREEPLRSPRDITVEQRTANKKAAANGQGTELRSYIRAYRKQIQLPINYESSIFASKTPQRCMSHNSVLTLFCNTDKKPLCVNCIHQLSTHKTHQIVPINQANECLKTELSSIIQKIQKTTLPTLQSFIAKNKTNFDRVEQDLEITISAVKQQFDHLLSFIEGRKNDQIKFYQDARLRCKQEYSSFASEFSKAELFFKETIKQITERNGEEHVLFNHNLASHLAKLDSLLVPHLAQYQSFQVQKIRTELSEMIYKVKQSIKPHQTAVCTSLAVDRKESLDKTNLKIALWKTKKGDLNPQQSQKNLLNTTKQNKFISIDALKVLYTPRQYSKVLHSPRKNENQHKFGLNCSNKFSLEKNRKVESQAIDKTLKRKIEESNNPPKNPFEERGRECKQ